MASKYENTAWEKEHAQARRKDFLERQDKFL